MRHGVDDDRGATTTDCTLYLCALAYRYLHKASTDADVAAVNSPPYAYGQKLPDWA